MRFANRRDAGRQLAGKLGEYANRSDVVVLGLPRGGVPVAAEVATSLKAPLDVFLVRKLGVPGHPELAMGAIAAGGVQVLSATLIEDLGIPASAVQQVAAREKIELDRHDRAFRSGRQPVPVAGRVVIIVDDGLATGATMEAAVTALRQLGPTAIVIAVPVGAPDTCTRLRRFADRVVCLNQPSLFNAVGQWYDDFSQTTDEEVQRLLAPARTTGNPIRQNSTDTASIVRAHAIPLHGDPDQYNTLIDAVGNARVVLLGEATHGTHEFYRERAFITRRLIIEKGFTGVAVEADWPDAYRVNRYVRGISDDRNTVDALDDFRRFPTWMWRNADMLDFVGWLRAHNDGQPADGCTGFYGLDLYSLNASTRAVLEYLDKVDPTAARRARQRYGCFDQFGGDMQEYGHITALGLHPSCEDAVVNQLRDLLRRRADYASRDGNVAAAEFFFAEQNARLVQNAEAYYRSMFGGRSESWNLRDRHMAESLAELLRFLGRVSREPRVVVWAHNSHLGDARATEMGDGGEVNVGQLVRESMQNDAVAVGFTTYSGSVTAAVEWDGPALRRHVRPALPGSYERLFHEVGLQRMLLPLHTSTELAAALDTPRLERAIGVLYVPESERRSHYFRARLPQQFDYVLHFDETRAVEPLERTAAWESGELAETYPTGL